MAISSEDQTSSDESDGPTQAEAPAPRSIEEVLADPTTSYWLKTAIKTLVDRDPVDALNDALVLAALLEERLRIALGIDEEGR
jgi:TPP-dependent pyruvate/acetoin dehydrogenase alpha subunit